ncbi:MAG: DEAD/DEAH box helicase [Patescibacteria group bacterium]|nr:DEAD/DEAH box helicase [Patescibacteria group bacterium]
MSSRGPEFDFSHENYVPKLAAIHRYFGNKGIPQRVLLGGFQEEAVPYPELFRTIRDFWIKIAPEFQRLGLRRDPYIYQLAGAMELIHMLIGNSIVANHDDYGMGKTYTSLLTWLAYRFEPTFGAGESRMIVVGTNRQIQQAHKDYLEAGVSPYEMFLWNDPNNNLTPREQLDQLGRFSSGVIFLSHEAFLLENLTESLESTIAPDLLVIDEAQELQLGGANPEAKRTQALLNLWSRLRRRGGHLMITTRTPVNKDVSELKMWTGTDNVQIPAICRHQEDFFEMPPIRTFILRIPTDKQNTTLQDEASILYPWVAHLIDQLLENPNATIIVFSRFAESESETAPYSLESLRKLLQKKGIRATQLYSGAFRLSTEIASLQQNRVALCTYESAAASLGLNPIESKTYVIFLTLPPNGAQFDQAVHRIHRPNRGFQQNTIIIPLVTNGSSGSEGTLLLQRIIENIRVNASITGQKPPWMEDISEISAPPAVPAISPDVAIEELSKQLDSLRATRFREYAPLMLKLIGRFGSEGLLVTQLNTQQALAEWSKDQGVHVDLGEYCTLGMRLQYMVWLWQRSNPMFTPKATEIGTQAANLNSFIESLLSSWETWGYKPDIWAIMISNDPQILNPQTLKPDIPVYTTTHPQTEANLQEAPEPIPFSPVFPSPGDFLTSNTWLNSEMSREDLLKHMEYWIENGLLDREVTIDTFHIYAQIRSELSGRQVLKDLSFPSLVDSQAHKTFMERCLRRIANYYRNEGVRILKDVNAFDELPDEKLTQIALANIFDKYYQAHEQPIRDAIVLLEEYSRFFKLHFEPGFEEIPPHIFFLAKSLLTQREERKSLIAKMNEQRKAKEEKRNPQNIPSAQEPDNATVLAFVRNVIRLWSEQETTRNQQERENQEGAAAITKLAEAAQPPITGNPDQAPASSLFAHGGDHLEGVQDGGKMGMQETMPVPKTRSATGKGKPLTDKAEYSLGPYILQCITSKESTESNAPGGVVALCRRLKAVEQVPASEITNALLEQAAENGGFIPGWLLNMHFPHLGPPTLYDYINDELSRRVPVTTLDRYKPPEKDYQKGSTLKYKNTIYWYARGLLMLPTGEQNLNAKSINLEWLKSVVEYLSEFQPELLETTHQLFDERLRVRYIQAEETNGVFQNDFVLVCSENKAQSPVFIPVSRQCPELSHIIKELINNRGFLDNTIVEKLMGKAAEYNPPARNELRRIEYAFGVRLVVWQRLQGTGDDTYACLAQLNLPEAVNREALRWATSTSDRTNAHVIELPEAKVVWRKPTGENTIEQRARRIVVFPTKSSIQPFVIVPKGRFVDYLDTAMEKGSFSSFEMRTIKGFVLGSFENAIYSFNREFTSRGLPALIISSGDKRYFIRGIT